MSSTRSLRAAALAGVILSAACQFDREVAVRTEPTPVVHAVLNPAVNEYVVLLEEVLGGHITLNEDEIFDPADPIHTGVGIPIVGARVVIRDESGDSAVGLEQFGPRGGTGVYRFSNSRATDPQALLLVPGARYYLEVATPVGDELYGTTVIPSFPESPVISAPRIFNRETDTLRMIWPAVADAKRYLVRIESPRGPFALFVGETSIVIPGELRNFWQLEVPNVFLPGFAQRVQVSAVDENFFDYYRSNNDPFSGRGLINHIEGGFGVFGSFVPLATTEVRVTATIDQPYEGTFELADTITGAPRYLLLYEEGRRDGAVQLTGNYQRDDSPEALYLVGTLVNGSASLALLRSQLLSDTVQTIRGQFRGDSLIAVIAEGDTAVYRRRTP